MWRKLTGGIATLNHRLTAVIPSGSKRIAMLLLTSIALVGCSGDAAVQGKVTIPDAKVFNKTKGTKSPPAHAPNQ